MGDNYVIINREPKHSLGDLRGDLNTAGILGIHLDTLDGLLFAKSPRWDLRGVDGRRLETPAPFYLGPMCVT